MPPAAAYAKAIIAALVALATALATAAEDGNISLAEWLTAAAATLVALGAVYGVPNRPPTEGANRTGQEPGK